ncbi:MAG: hypothetical protein L6Q38_13320, partial [Nitrospira sp.]|nr:hypothetical protein [Nitrospira sp.]
LRQFGVGRVEDAVTIQSGEPVEHDFVDAKVDPVTRRRCGGGRVEGASLRSDGRTQLRERG